MSCCCVSWWVTTSVTGWFDYFSIFGLLRQWKCAHLPKKFKISKILPNTKSILKKLPRTFKILPNVVTSVTTEAQIFLIRSLPKSNHLQFQMTVSKCIIFLVKLFLGNFLRHLAIFFWSHWMQAVRHFKIISELSHAPERTRWDSFREEARTNRRIFGWDWRGEITEWSILDWTQGEKQLLRNF